MSRQSGEVRVYWSALSHEPLRLAQWPNEDNVVAFDPASGDTHLVTALATFLLKLLENGPLTGEDLLSKIRESGRFNDQAKTLNAELDSYLFPLRTLGFIRVSRR